MENVKILIYELIKLCLPMLIGFIAVKTKYLPNIKDNIGTLVSKILFPVLMFCIFMDPELSLKQIGQNYQILLVSCLWVAIAFFVGLFTAKAIKLEKNRVPVFSILMGMSNVTYMGMPICTAMFGKEQGSLGVALVSLSGHIVMWTLGVIILNSQSGEKKKFSLKKLASPVTVAIALSLILKASGLVLPDIIYNPLDTLGNTTPYISLVYIGMIIASSSFKEAFRDKAIGIYALLKLIVMPLVLGLCLRLIPQSFLSSDMQTLIFVEYSTSAMISLTPYFKECGFDSDFAGRLVFFTVTLNILTMPLVLFINNLF